MGLGSCPTFRIMGDKTQAQGIFNLGIDRYLVLLTEIGERRLKALGMARAIDGQSQFETIPTGTNKAKGNLNRSRKPGNRSPR